MRNTALRTGAAQQDADVRGVGPSNDTVVWLGRQRDQMGPIMSNASKFSTYHEYLEQVEQERHHTAVLRAFLELAPRRRVINWLCGRLNIEAPEAFEDLKTDVEYSPKCENRSLGRVDLRLELTGNGRWHVIYIENKWKASERPSQLSDYATGLDEEGSKGADTALVFLTADGAWPFQESVSKKGTPTVVSLDYRDVTDFMDEVLEPDRPSGFSPFFDDYLSSMMPRLGRIDIGRACVAEENWEPPSMSGRWLGALKGGGSDLDSLAVRTWMNRTVRLAMDGAVAKIKPAHPGEHGSDLMVSVIGANAVGFQKALPEDVIEALRDFEPKGKPTSLLTAVKLSYSVTKVGPSVKILVGSRLDPYPSNMKKFNERVQKRHIDMSAVRQARGEIAQRLEDAAHELLPGQMKIRTFHETQGGFPMASAFRGWHTGFEIPVSDRNCEKPTMSFDQFRTVFVGLVKEAEKHFSAETAKA